MRARSSPAHPYLPAGGLLLGAFTWGVIWYPYRLLEQAGLSGSLASLATYLIALVPALVLFHRQLPRHTTRWLALLAVALSSGWTNLAYVLAVIHGEVMRVLLLFYLAPLWTVLLAHFILGERTDRYGYGVVALSLAGAVAMLYSGDGRFPLPANVAEWLGLSAGIGFALANVLSRWVGEIPIGTRGVWVLAGVVAISAVPALPDGDGAAVLAALDGPGWALLTVTGLLLLAATLGVQYGVAHMPANRAIVILLSELVVAGFASWWLAGEAMSAREWLGGAMIVAATLLSGKMAHKHD